MSRQIQARSASDRHLSGPFNFDDYFFQSKLWPRHKTVERALLSTNDEHSPPPHLAFVSALILSDDIHHCALDPFHLNCDPLMLAF
jgi:hypothetical protein